MKSLDDARLDPFRNLKRSNLTRWTRLFVAEGEKLTLRLAASRHEFLSALLSTEHAERLIPELPAEADLFVLPKCEIERLIGFEFHRGVLACGRRAKEPPLEEFAGRAGRLCLLAFPEIQDPDNLGAIVRTSCGLGADGIVLGPLSTYAFSRRVLRVSMGTAFELPVFEVEEIAATLRLLRECRVESVAAVLEDAAIPLERYRAPERLALWFGNEAHGLPGSLVDACASRITIPMDARADSLNVAMSVGIILFHLGAQRRGEGIDHAAGDVART